jgi:hypothetical protein
MSQVSMIGLMLGVERLCWNEHSLRVATGQEENVVQGREMIAHLLWSVTDDC